MTLEIINSIDQSTWRAYIDQHPQGNIFQTPEMYQVFEKTKGFRPELWVALEGDERILALLVPVQVTLMDGIFHRLTTRSIIYGGCLYTQGNSGEGALAELLERCSKKTSRQALFTEIRHLSDVSPVQSILQRCGYNYEDHLNYLINLDCPPDQVLQNIGSRTRKNIRHAISKGEVNVEEITERDHIPSWYEVIQKTYHDARVPLSDRSLFDSAFDVLHPLGMIKFWLARVGSAPAAASVELLYKGKIYGWYGGIDRTYSKEMPGEVLMWHILEWGANNGYKVYDFGGAGKPGEKYGVRDFKAKFGGVLVCFGRNRKIHSPGLLRLSERGYQAYRSLSGSFQRFSSPR